MEDLPESDSEILPHTIPTIFVILGATGDLAARKILPSLFRLYKKNNLPKILTIVGFSRRAMNNNQFREYVYEVLKNHKEVKTKKDAEAFLGRILYQKGYFDELSHYKQLAGVLGEIDGQWKTCSNKLFYLAVPPKYYKSIFVNLNKSGLTKGCSPEEGWTRVIVEKPFGQDLETARDLEKLLSSLFKEEQIYRIDHYLGKEPLQNILTFRFANTMFEQSWSGRYIDSIEVKLLEMGNVEKRGVFYDGVGALRDVGQNHLLQMLAIATMENPGRYDSESIRQKREALLKMIRIPTKKQIAEESFRAQYEGYTEEKGVDKFSTTETYFKTRLRINSPRWEGVRITLEGGKGLKEQKKEIVVRFKHPHPCLCPPQSSHDYHNKVIFALEPKEEITFRLWSKKPGYKMEVEERSFDLPYRDIKERTQYTEEYEKLLLDVFNGDQTLFVTGLEMESMWKYTDAIVEEWQKNNVPLNSYKQLTDEIRGVANEKLLQEKMVLKREIGIVGLGKMGANIARQLTSKGWRVVGYNRSPEATEKLEAEGIEGAYSLESLYVKLPKPRVIWVMVPSGEANNKVIGSLSLLLDKDDFVIDGGNTFYKDSIYHGRLLAKRGINFVDVGVSGGPEGARNGAALFIGGDNDSYEYLLPLYNEIATSEGYSFFDGIGAGHFVKMVHNGIEYGMMQAIAEGFDILSQSPYKLHLSQVARVYNHGSVIESRLIDWMGEAFKLFGDTLRGISGQAAESGEGRWTTQVAKTLGIRDEVIRNALTARVRSQKNPNFQGKIIQALRNRFGGHDAKQK